MGAPRDLDQSSEDVARLLAGYAPLPGVADELLGPDGRLRPVWAPLIAHLASQSREGLEGQFARGDQYLADAGVLYRQMTSEGVAEREWPLSHIPVLISADEWQTVSQGIMQRADLLERVMADLYGPGKLVEDGLLPAELVAHNPEWLRPIVGLQPRSGHFLHFLAFEIGRSPDGRWFVLGDRTQAPSGAGFALENRVATRRVFKELFPEAPVERLSEFFRQFRDALTGLSDGKDGQVGIVTPGQHSDTYLEHAYIAQYLGMMLLEGGDLKVQDGALKVRTIHGADPVRVLWRRMDSRFADPLELDESSALGTPGMVSALRSGAVTMVNALGSGVLETRALMAFLPGMAQALLGAPLSLPNIATWWCGQAAERNYVRENLDQMMIGPAQSTHLPFDLHATTALGGKFRQAARLPVAEWLEQEGDALVGQEAVTLSTTPAMIDGQLVPRPMVVRVFAARTPQGWTVMPGGYARIGRTEDPTALALQAGGSVADVWVVSDGEVTAEPLNTAPVGPFLRRSEGPLPARAADNLFWLGRYVERGEAALRLLRAYNLRLEAHGSDVLPLLDGLRAYMTYQGLAPETAMPPGLLSLFDASRGCASQVRDRFSNDGWNALTDLSRTAHKMAGQLRHGDDAIRELSGLLHKQAAFSGLVHENMFRSNGWRFLTIGRALERATQMSAALARFADADAPAGSFDVAVELGESVLTHRRRYQVETSRNTVIDLLALDADNPRSLVFQLQRLHDEAARLIDPEAGVQIDDLGRQILLLLTELKVATPEALNTSRFAALQPEFGQMSNTLTAQYLS